MLVQLRWTPVTGFTENIMDELTRKIHLHLRNQNGMSLGALKRQFPNVNDLDTIIVNSPELFWIANRDTRNKEITAKIDIKLCCSYLLSTCNGFCGCLHVCKDFILCRQFCPDPCKKGLSHIIMNSHNMLLLSSYKGSGLELLLLSSFPRLCKSYQDNGICRQTFCGYLHLCREFVLGTCLGKCKLATLNWRLATELHNIESNHNKKVLFMFNMDPTKLDHKVIFCNILSANDSSLGKEANVKKVPLAESKPNKTENDRLLLCAHYLNGNCQNKNCSRLHMCKEFLVDDSKCNPEICKFGFSHSPLDVHNRNVLLRSGIYLQNRRELLKHLRDSFPRVCSYHQDGFGCSHAKCDRLHMCLKFCIGRCNNMKCALSHNFTDRHNLEILQHFFLNKDESMGKEFILTNVLFSKVSLTNSKTQDGKYASAGNTGERNSIYQSTPDLFKRSPLMNDANELRGSELPDKKQSIKLKVQTSGEKEVLSTKICPEKEANVEKVPQAENKPSKEFNSPLSLCFHYLNGNCQDRNCLGLHMCKEFLDDGSKCNQEICKFGLSHSPLDIHNRNVLLKSGIHDNNGNELLKHLRSLFPRVCTSHQHGFGCSHAQCDRLHICLEFCNGCCNNLKCALSHNLKSKHNLKVLQHFFLHKTWIQGEYTEKEFILRNVLFSQCLTNAKTQDVKYASAGNIAKRNPVCLSTSRLLKSVGLQNDLIEKCASDLPEKKESIESEDEALSEKDVFYHILKNKSDGFCSVTDIINFLNLDSEESALAWLQHHKHTFRIVTTKSNERNVYLCLAEARPCYKYWQMDVGCTNRDCKMFHVCQAFLSGKSHNMRTCKLNHNLKDAREKKLMEQLEWSVNEDQLLLILKIRYPYVCSYYANKCCEYGEDLCPNLHVCIDFMEGTCKKQGLCRFKHESGVSGRQAKRLMKEYQIKNDEFRACIVIPELIKEDMDDYAMSLDLFDWLKEEGICRSFLVDECSSESDCHLIHPPSKSSYLWQYKKACNNEVWINFPKDINSSIEKKYCDPSVSSFKDDRLYFLFSHDITDCNGIYDGSDVAVRRLSTMSTVHDAAGPLATEWKWYWCVDSRTWEEYKGNVTSDVIEEAYLVGDPRCYFSTNQFMYILTFQDMNQENQDERYSTKRSVRRRPLYKETKSTRQRLGILPSYSTPLHWPETFKPGQRIPLKDAAIYKKLIDSFQSTMPGFKLVTIEEVCNSTHFAKFQMKKEELSQRLSDVNEMTLYHGTGHGVIDQICVQNFDWRLCGKNATQFGQGSYFSNNARYSHRFSTPDAERIFYMFASEVLVGQYVQGNSSMKRPPNLPNSDVELYDSCVNNVNNPIIFVIYERDQYYPRYLLSYRQTRI